MSGATSGSGELANTPVLLGLMQQEVEALFAFAEQRSYERW